MDSKIIDLHLKIKIWDSIKTSIISEADIFEFDYKELVRTKDPKNLRQRNIQNQIANAEKLIKNFSEFRLNSIPIEKLIRTKHLKIEEWSLFRIQRADSFQIKQGRLPVLNEPKDHLIFRFPFSILLLNSESFSTYFEQFQVSVSNSRTYDGLSLGDLFWVDEVDSRDLKSPESYKTFKVDGLV